VAGAPGFEPGNGGIKIRRMTLNGLHISPDWGQEPACCINRLRVDPDQAAHLRETEAGPCPTRVESSGVAMNRGALRETATAPARDQIL
jgi:hypothetical protein